MTASLADRLRAELPMEPATASNSVATEPVGVHADAGRLPVLPGVDEPRWQRWLGVMLALALTLGFWRTTMTYWTPAHHGVDQNGYLVGGRQVAKSLTMKLAPTSPGSTQFDPHAFVGRMWVGVDYGQPSERFYPKYPLGLPLLYAISLWVGGDDLGPVIAYHISPVTMTLSVLATFLLVRRVAGSYAGLLAMLVYATSPVTLHLANNPNSHASTVFCVAFGMVALLHWWQLGGWAIGLLAGLLLGFAATIRYTEATLLLPLLWVVATRMWGADRRAFWVLAHAMAMLILAVALYVLTSLPPGVGRTAGIAVVTAMLLASLAGILHHARRLLAEGVNWLRVRIWRDCGMVLLGWLVPVAALLIYNLAAIGTLTGYDPTNESTGFRWEYFWDNWETTLRHLGTNGISLMFPLALMGMTAMFFWNSMLAVWLALWVLPCLAVYTFYYWAPDGSAIGFLRFFMTIIPGLLVAAMWLIVDVSALLASRPEAAPKPWRPWKAVVVLLVGVSALLLTDPAVRLGVQPLTLTPRSAYFDDDRLAENWARLDRYGGHYAMMLGVGALSAALTAGGLLGRRASGTIVAGVVVMLSAASQLQSALPAMEAESYSRTQLDRNVQRILASVPSGAVLFCSDTGILHHVQFLRDLYLYQPETFTRRFVDQINPANRDFRVEDPQGWDPGRRAGLYERLKGFDQNRLDEQMRAVVNGGLDSNRRVFIAAPRNPGEARRRQTVDSKPPTLPEPYRRALPAAQYDMAEVDVWVLNPPVQTDLPRGGVPRAKRDPRHAFRPSGWALYEVTRKPTSPPARATGGAR
jgi:4-amino-4-deoxy-L-arabinose transferase-like glycosyltransferase